MKLRHQLAIAGMGFCCLCFAGPSDTSTDLQRQFEERIQGEDPGPQVSSFWDWSSSADFIGTSRFSTEEVSSQDIGFRQVQSSLSYNRFLSCFEIVSIGAGYSNVGIHWDDNPRFEQSSFDNVFVTIGAQCTRYRGWLWQGNFTARFNTDVGSVSHHVLYTGALWGRYELVPCFGMHTGFFAETGLRKDKVWPILGFDKQLTKQIKLYAVYPFEASVTYDYCGPWSIAAATKFFRTRHRLSPDADLSNGLIEYRNIGTELRVMYELPPCISAQIHVGHAYGGDLIVADQRDNNSTHYKFRSAPYVGGELSFRF